MTALSEGDHRAFDKIFLKYYDQSVAFVRSMIKREEDAEDIVSGIFENLWINRERLTEVRNFNAYIYSVMKNAIFNYFRHQKVQNSYVDNFVEHTTGYASDEEFIAKEMALCIELAVSQMPEQRRKVFELHNNEGKTNAEISELLGISKKTVEKHLRLALTDIKKVVLLLLWFFYQY